MASIPLALIAASSAMKPGRWFLWQVGVNAPGRPNSTILRPAKYSCVVIGLGPSGVTRRKVALGSVSPILIVIVRLLGKEGGQSSGGRAAAQCASALGRQRQREYARRRRRRSAWRGLRSASAAPSGFCCRFSAKQARPASPACGLGREPPAFRRLDEQIARRAGLGVGAEAPGVGAGRRPARRRARRGRSARGTAAAAAAIVAA